MVMPNSIDGCRVFIKSYGCQMNVYDSQKMSDMLSAVGCLFVDNYDNADIVILNTCCIREKAEDKLFSDLGRIRVYKDRANQLGKKYIVAVTGCIAQLKKEDIFKKSQCVDVILGPQMIQNIVPSIIKKLNINEPIPAFVSFNSEEKFKSFTENKRIINDVSAFVTIQEGCNNFCTYCVVPHTRGREVSRSVDDILTEIKMLVYSGVKEIVLLGQNVNSYNGINSKGETYSLAKIICKIANDFPQVKRLRYTTSHPKDITDDLLDAYRNVDILMPFLHLPIQSGSNRILSEMNRGYTVNDYLKSIDKLRNTRSDIAFSSDFIVGFPGETAVDFNETLSVIKEIQYAQAYSFKYSPRPNTKAALMQNQIQEDIKEERLAVLQELLNNQQRTYNDSSVGKNLDVLLEKKGKYPNQLVGKTQYSQAVSVDNEGDIYKIGDVVNVKIIENLSHSLSGRILNAI